MAMVAVASGWLLTYLFVCAGWILVRVVLLFLVLRCTAARLSISVSSASDGIGLSRWSGPRSGSNEERRPSGMPLERLKMDEDSGALADDGAANEFEGGRRAFHGSGPRPPVTHNTFV